MDDMTPEEIEKMKKLNEEREKSNIEKQEKWNKMTVEDRFYSSAENKIKENWIAFPAIPAEAEGEEPTPTNVQEVALDPESLKEFENMINGIKRGCVINVDKLIPVGGEEQSKGKAPPKGKGAPVAGEESKPL